MSKSLLERIKAQSDDQDLKTIEVPEWGDGAGPLIIHYRKVTLADMSSARAVARDDPFRTNCEIICLKALDAEGKPMFKRLDALELMQHADPQIVVRIADAMTVRPSAEAAEKN